MQCRVLQASIAGYHEHFIRRASAAQRRHLSDNALLRFEVAQSARALHRGHEQGVTLGNRPGCDSYASNKARVENWQTLIAYMRDFTVTKTTQQWVEALGAVGVPCADQQPSCEESRGCFLLDRVCP